VSTLTGLEYLLETSSPKEGSTVIWSLKFGIVELEETAVSRQQLDKHLSAATEYTSNSTITVGRYDFYRVCVGSKT
jgi:hypothetical protein